MRLSSSRMAVPQRGDALVDVVASGLKRPKRVKSKQAAHCSSMCDDDQELSCECDACCYDDYDDSELLRSHRAARRRYCYRDMFFVRVFSTCCCLALRRKSDLRVFLGLQSLVLPNFVHSVYNPLVAAALRARRSELS